MKYDFNINSLYADVRNIYNQYADKGEREEAIAKYLLSLEAKGVSQDITNQIAQNYGVELEDKK